MAYLIGLSLGFCIKDVLNNYIQENDILYVIANTKAVTEKDWVLVANECLRCHWQGDIKGVEIMKRMVQEGKIIQPALFIPNFRISIDYGRWFANIHGKEIQNEEVPSGFHGFEWIRSNPE